MHQYFNIVSSLVVVILGFGLVCISNFTAEAQSTDQQMRYAVQGDSVYIYHIRSMQPGQGFNIYRKDEGESEFTKLNKTPIRGITYAA